MADNLVNNVIKVEGQAVQAAQVQAVQVQAQYKKETQPAKTAKPVETAPQEEAPSKEMVKAASRAGARLTNLQFRVDPEKNEVMVVVVDKATQKVIATIPPEDMKNIPPGELMQYSA